MYTCPKCDKEIRDIFNYCPHCGEYIDTIMALRKRSPEWWHGKAEALRGAAAILRAYEKHELGVLADTYELGYGGIFIEPVYKMLCGMSLELIFKGILIAQNKKIPRSHNLRDLAKSAGVGTPPETTTYLDLLTHAVKWEGRYPVPLTTAEWLQEGNLHADVSGSGKLSDIAKRVEFVVGWDAFDRVWKEAEQILFEQSRQEGE